MPPAPNPPEFPPADQHPADHRHPRERLLTGFAAVEAFPALGLTRDAIIEAASETPPRREAIVAGVESDLALTIAALRLANARRPGTRRPQVESVVDATRRLTPEQLRRAAEQTRTFDFFDRIAPFDLSPERIRLHASTTQRLALRIAREVGYRARNRLAVSSLLHDIGQLAMLCAFPDYRAVIGSGTPEARMVRERRAYGIDHPAAAGVLVRRWDLPESIATAIEQHHASRPSEEAAIIKLADMLALHTLDAPIDHRELIRTARRAGVDRGTLRRILFELPNGTIGPPRSVDVCPLSERELDVLRGLAGGKVYKEIAHGMGISPSTIRSHVNNIYAKLGVGDRAQAVLLAASRNWL